ncbi:MAG: NADH oxidase, partial [Deltaproteobacteria bacterium]|nr:NADH oxidase [Deltaproteobacteria bacterium]
MTDSLAKRLRLPNGVFLPNRIAKAAMSERVAHRGGAPSEGHVRLYEQWGEGGVGVLITGDVMIDRGTRGETGNVVVEDYRDREGLTAWAAAAKKNGAHIWMQLTHPGRQSTRFLSPPPVAPSAVPMTGPGSQAFARPRALGPTEILD